MHDPQSYSSRLDGSWGGGPHGDRFTSPQTNPSVINHHLWWEQALFEQNNAKCEHCASILWHGCHFLRRSRFLLTHYRAFYAASMLFFVTEAGAQGCFKRCSGGGGGGGGQKKLHGSSYPAAFPTKVIRDWKLRTWAPCSRFAHISSLTFY